MSTERLWVAFDCETTGFPPDGRLIEIAALSFADGGEIVDEFHALVSPPTDIPKFITELTGISASTVAGADPAEVVLRRFATWLNPKATLVAHNVPFDIRILVGESPSIVFALPNTAIDTLRIARTLGTFRNNKLETIGNALCPKVSEYHRATADAEVVRQLLLHALERRLDLTHPELFQGQSLRQVLELFD